MQEAEIQGKHLIFFTGPSPQYKANAAVLVSEPCQHTTSLEPHSIQKIRLLWLSTTNSAPCSWWTLADQNCILT